MASGVAALVRHLPAGSPAIFYCIHSLVEKANSLCREVPAQQADTWKNWQGESESCKKILDLLLRLISLVDIQVNFCCFDSLSVSGFCYLLRMFNYRIKLSMIFDEISVEESRLKFWPRHYL